MKADYRVGFYSGQWEIYDEDPLPDLATAEWNPDATSTTGWIQFG